MSVLESVRQVASANLPTEWGEFRIFGFEKEFDQGGWPRRSTAVALSIGDLKKAPPLLRIHSQCLTGDVFGSLRCDCGQQLKMALATIAREGAGLIIYEMEEGRGIGLIPKLLAYELQDGGSDTVEANERLGLKNDYRNYSFAIEILKSFGVSQVRLLSNSPEKARALRSSGIDVLERVPCEVDVHPCAESYLRTKKEKLGHILTRIAAPAHSAAYRVKPSLGLPRRKGLLAMPAPLPPEKEATPQQSRIPVSTKYPFTDVETAVAEIRAGRMIVLVDDEDRENEGDLTMAAELVTPEAINFMAQYGRGLICVSMTPERLDYLRLRPMSTENTSQFGTAFTESIDVLGRGVTTGISAYDRAQTILASVDPATRPSDLARPGHIFPLRARKGGVLVRGGQTEASVDLTRLAGLVPAGVICEILNPDGTMARVPDLTQFCKTHGLKMLTVAELLRYRLAREQCVFRKGEAVVNTPLGKFLMVAFGCEIDNETHIALVRGDPRSSAAPPLVQLHSQCLVGDFFGASSCSCAGDIQASLQQIAEEETGALICLHHNSHDFSIEKVGDQNVLAFHGGQADSNCAGNSRQKQLDTGVAAQILADLHLQRIRMFSNGGLDLVGLSGYGVEIVETIPAPGCRETAGTLASA